MIGSGSIRWVPPVNIHLTLKFLGNIPAPHLDFLKQMLIGIAERAKPFDMQISGIGSFPSSKRPRIIWAGIHAPAALFSLQKEIEEKSTRFGYEKETKTFSPHLTIGRVHQEATAKELERIGNALASIQLGGIITSRVDSVHLYQSDLNPKGSIYTKLFSVPLR